MKNYLDKIAFIVALLFAWTACEPPATDESEDFLRLSHQELKDKIKGAWAMQTIGVTYGGPTEFRYKKHIIPDSVEIIWSDSLIRHNMEHRAGLYDDIYLDLTFVEILEKEGLDAPASSFGQAYANAKYPLWHANQQGRYNILNGMEPPETGHWLNNPHADDIDFQIEADFAGIMNPGMPASAISICDRVGHIMNYGDGYYGGVFVAGMYAYAFMEDDLTQVVNKALALIPEQSTFHQCLADVILWHEENPQDWKKNWQMIEDKWGEDIGCPDGVFADFNIDAKLNSAYVLLGLLYGEGDIGKTMEIATRAGQDSDCNPATAAGVLGTMMGYQAIPDYWKNSLKPVEDMKFSHTSVSLNDAYQLSYKHALALIEKNGGEVDENEVRVKWQPVEPVPLEQSFPGYEPIKKVGINKQIYHTDPQVLEIPFEGSGIVITGRTRHQDITPQDNLDDFAFEVNYYIDGALTKTMKLPLDFITRAHELFFLYELPPGEHLLKMEITNPRDKVYLDVNSIITYSKSAENPV
ncbi:MAG: ADP-ribosylglycohydrolase family protein [Candidatus Cyclobacteriaceae bacterium M3_2C_046]